MTVAALPRAISPGFRRLSDFPKSPFAVDLGNPLLRYPRFIAPAMGNWSVDCAAGAMGNNNVRIPAIGRYNASGAPYPSQGRMSAHIFSLGLGADGNAARFTRMGMMNDYVGTTSVKRGGFRTTDCTNGFTSLTEFTWFCEFLPFNLGVGRYIISNSQSNTLAGRPNLSVDTNGAVIFRSGGSGEQVTTSNGAVRVGQWATIACVFRSGGECAVFVNGVKLGTDTDAGGARTAQYAYFNIGGTQFGVLDNALSGVVRNLVMVDWAWDDGAAIDACMDSRQWFRPIVSTLYFIPAVAPASQRYQMVI